MLTSYDECRIVKRTTAFTSFLNRFTSNSNTPIIKDFHAQAGYNINDVQKQANDAIAAYEERGSSLKSHFLRTTGRSFSNDSSAVEILLSFLPDGDYTSVICGGLTLVLNVSRLKSLLLSQ